MSSGTRTVNTIQYSASYLGKKIMMTMMIHIRANGGFKYTALIEINKCEHNTLLRICMPNHLENRPQMYCYYYDKRAYATRIIAREMHKCMCECVWFGWCILYVFREHFSFSLFFQCNDAMIQIRCMVNKCIIKQYRRRRIAQN